MPHPPRSQSSSPSQQGVHTRALPTLSSMLKPNSSSYNAPIRRITSRRARPTPASIADLFASSLVMASFCADHSPRARKLSRMPVSARKEDAVGFRGRNVTGSRPQPSRKRLDSFRSSTANLGMRGVRTQPVRSCAFPQTSEVEDHVEDACDELYVDLPSSPKEGERPNWRRGLNRKPTFELPRIPDRVKDGLYVDLPLSRQGSQKSDWRDELNRQPERQSPRARNRDVTEATSNLSTALPIPCTAVISHVSRCTAVIPTGVVFDHTPDLPTDTIRQHMEPTSVERIELSSRGPEEDPAVKEFLTALEDPKKSNQYVFRLYRQLRSPGVALLKKNIRGKLLRRFADPMNKRLSDTRRYLALVEDMIMADFPMSRSLWTSAIHLAGRSAGRVARKDLVRAIGIWQAMEHQGRVESDDVVFTVLFDIAIKSGQFTVAERILNQMTSRGISFTRFGHVSKMYYYGMVGDADGIRQTYDEFIKAGHPVDTTVLNCLIASFARVNDMQTVSRLYDSMLEAHRSLQGEASLANPQTSQLLPSLTSEMSFYRRKSKDLGRQLKILTLVKDQMREQHRAIQQALPMSPDTRTFHIVLYHYACRTGDLKRSMSTIADMESIYAVPPRGMIYLLLFEGFATHGGRRKSWNAERLRHVWQTYHRALFESMKRYDERFRRRTQKLVWENPLDESVRTTKQVRRHKQPATPSSPTELYIPLPSGNLNANNPIDQDQRESEEDEADDEGGDDGPDGLENIDVDQLFNNPAHTREAEEEMAELDRQIENGVFLGRRMIVLILRAFGACSDPDELLDVWLTLERLWYPAKRRATDVQFIREEVEKQMSKAQSQTERERYRRRV